jgi:multifunctional beta-oxidation protein
MEVLDKGKAAAVTTVVETKDKATGKVIFENQSTVSAFYSRVSPSLC